MLHSVRHLLNRQKVGGEAERGWNLLQEGVGDIANRCFKRKRAEEGIHLRQNVKSHKIPSNAGTCKCNPHAEQK